METPIDATTGAAADAIEDAARRSTFGIVVGTGAQRWGGIGTGTLVRWQDALHILTADHVIANTPVDDLRFFLPNQTPPATVSREELTRMTWLPASGLRPFRELNVLGIQRETNLDLAAIKVSDSALSNSSAAAFDLCDEEFDASEGMTSLVIGFPHDISRIMGDDARVVFTQTDWSPVEAPRSGLAGFDPTIHFLTRYTPPQSTPKANPFGLSGAARWARRAPTPSVWFPNIDVIGVTLAYYESSQMLKVLRRSAVNRFLREASTA